MPNPFSHWPETMPVLLARQERLQRGARRKIIRMLIGVGLFWAACAVVAVGFVDWVNG